MFHSHIPLSIPTSFAMDFPCTFSKSVAVSVEDY